MSGPNLQLEHTLLAKGGLLAGIDEVGRGAFGGPVCVGVCVIDANVGAIPTGLKDSKLLSGVARDKLIAPIESWSVVTAVGQAEPYEIDDIGIVAALRLAAMRALGSLDVIPDHIILDGSHDWLTPAESDLFSEGPVFTSHVTMKVKADLSCASVAAASVVAKVYRDNLMRQLESIYPGYGWASHVGYGTAAHRSAIAKLGLTPAHRQSWKLT